MLNSNTVYYTAHLCFEIFQREQAALGGNADLLKARFSTFGIHCILADGHDVSALVNGFEKASTTRGKPTALICQTISGKSIWEEISTSCRILY